MEKKYQVFISSTYSDLIEERAAVTQCLLEMDCIPVGMEQFPASNMSQMDYIKMMLDNCDYYILILAGKYGSTDVDGIGFTEKEYDYAIEKEIPVMSFVIRNIGNLMNDKCENSDEGREKLENFRKKVCTGKLVKFYDNCETLKAAVAVSLNRCIQHFPAVGWVRGDNVKKPLSIEEKIEKIIRENRISNQNIDELFGEDTIIIDCGDANSHNIENAKTEPSNINSDDKVCAIDEKSGKSLSKVEWEEF